MNLFWSWECFQTSKPPAPRTLPMPMAMGVDESKLPVKSSYVNTLKYFNDLCQVENRWLRMSPKLYLHRNSQLLSHYDNFSKKYVFPGILVYLFYFSVWFFPQL